MQATAPLGGGASGSLSLLLRGQQLASGGIELRDGQVTVTLNSGAHLSGPVTSLDGNRIGATVTDASGKSYAVSVALTIPGDGTVQGQLSVQPTAGAASRSEREGGDGG